MGQRLLLVDSDRTFIKDHQVSLESAFDVEITPSLDGVMGKTESGGYAAVLISVEIADNKGYALCSALRKNPALGNLKIALISSKATEEEYRRHQSLKGRADLYLHKPIAPGALVEALSPLVPARHVDPDNPLGDLADGDLSGEDWLSELRTDLESDEPEVVPPTATQPVPQPASQTIALPSALIREAMADDSASQGRVQELEATLVQREARVVELEREFQNLQRQHDSVTQNLDDLERRQADALELQRKLAETEQALKRFEDGAEGGEALRNQLREGMKERQELLQQVDTTNSQLAEKTQKVIDLMKERDRLQQKAFDDETALNRMAELERAHASIEAQVASLEQSLVNASAQAAKVPGLEEALNQSREAETESREGLGRSEASLEASQAEVTMLSAAKAGLDERVAQLTAALAQKEAEFEAKADEVAGLETTLRSQGRNLVELEQQVAAKEEELAQLQTRKDEEQAELQARLDEQLKALQGQEEALESTRAELGTATARVSELEVSLTTEMDRLESVRADLVGRMNGELAAKDSQLEALAKQVGSLQDTLSRHEASLEAAAEAKSKLEAQLGQKQERLQAMGSLVLDMEVTLQKAAELARG